MNKFKAYYDRQVGTNKGLFTLHIIKNAKIIHAFRRLPAASGQLRLADQSWAYGSPIPYDEEIKPRSYKIWVRNQKQFGLWAGNKGIGEFWPISNDDNDPTVIINPNPKPGQQKAKYAVGAHPENKLPGSLACIVLDNETDQQIEQIKTMRAYVLTYISPIVRNIPLSVL